MARITVEDCLDKVENRFELVMLATKRARQIATGGKSPMVKEDSDKATVIALREIAEGLVTSDLLHKSGKFDEDSEEMALFEKKPATSKMAVEAAEEMEEEADLEEEFEDQVDEGSDED